MWLVASVNILNCRSCFPCVAQVMIFIKIDVALTEHHHMSDTVLGLGIQEWNKKTSVPIWDLSCLDIISLHGDDCWCFSPGRIPLLWLYCLFCQIKVLWLGKIKFAKAFFYCLWCYCRRRREKGRENEYELNEITGLLIPVSHWLISILK